MSSDLRCPWPPAPEELALHSSEVQVWCASLDLPSAWRHSLGQTLAEDELERAARFHFERDRRRFVARRGLLRVILGRYLGVQPDRVRFVYSDYGKPALAPGFTYGGLRFNLSHAAGISLYAFAVGRDVGVDVEHLRSDFEREQIAERFFSLHERSVLSSLPPKARIQAFFNCWTRKEAYIKARGEGLSLPLDQFDVSLAPAEPARLLATRGDLEDAERWSLYHLEPAPGYIAALAVEGRGCRLSCWSARGL